MSAVITPYPTPDAATPRTSMTSREWVIPPRPKPGRKPATDTPPTKRKAQNRAAQRAFRERRAARVGELEEQLMEEKEDHEKAQGELKDKIHGLELELQSFRSRCLVLEGLLDRERKENERFRTETEVENIRRRQQQQMQHHHHHQASPASTSSLNVHHFHSGSPTTPHQLKRASPFHQPSQDSSNTHVNSLPPIIQSLETGPEDSSGGGGENPSLTCGSCGPDACACAEDAIASVTGGAGLGNDLKRPASPSDPVSDEKRRRPSLAPVLTHQMPDHDERTPSAANDLMFKDSCGFCKDGMYCVCAETSMATPLTPSTDTLPPIAHQTQTPPPSEFDAGNSHQPHQLAVEITSDGAVKLPPRVSAARPNAAPASSAAPASRGCGPNGPGSCAQCQADPKSGLFCRLMAAKLGKGASGGCCGSKGGDGGCCKSTKKPQLPSPIPTQTQQPEKITLPSLPSLGLTCAETYQTLSSHRNFERASDDIGSWLPKLRATPTAEAERERSSRRMPMEVEAASIMSVLKDFDVRFGGL